LLVAEIRHKLFDLDDLDECGDDLIAQVRSLLSSTKEDLLTADVFGAIKYLPRVPYLTSVLQAIAERNPHATRFKDHWKRLAFTARDCSFNFWPSYPTPSDMPGEVTEPDAEMIGPNTLVFFEAKLHSGFGQFQIERQLLIGLEHAKDREFFLVLVTAGTRPPRVRGTEKPVAVQDYLQQIATSSELPDQCCQRIRDNADRVLWVSWQTLFSALVGAHVQHRRAAEPANESVRGAADMLHDLRALMEMRNLQPFDGIGKRAGPVSTVRPVLVDTGLVGQPSFQGITTATLADMRVVKPLPSGILWAARGRPPDIPVSFKLTAEKYEPRSLPHGWIISQQHPPELEHHRTFIRLVAEKYEPQTLPRGWIISEQHPRALDHHRTSIRSIVDKYGAQNLPEGWIVSKTYSPGPRAGQRPDFRCIVSKAALPAESFRLLKKRRQS